MAQTGFTPILIYASGTASNVPLAANLTSSASGSELALNYADGKLYYKDSGGVVQLLASKAGASGDVVGPASATDNAVARFDLTTGKLIQNSVVTIGDTGDVAGVVALTASGAITLSGGTANGVSYLNGSKVLTTGSALTFDGTTFKSPILFASSTDAGGSVLQIDTTSTAYGRVGGSTTMGYVAGTQSLWTIGGSEQMRLTSTGLGIGTSSPGYKVHSVASSAGGTTYAVVADNASGGAGVNIAGFGFANGGSLKSSITAAVYGNDYMAFNVGGSGTTERMRLDASGNLGLGVTPSAWNSAYKAFQFGAGSIASVTTGEAAYLHNAFINSGGSYAYVNTAAAARYSQAGGVHYWFNAPSGTAGNAISFTQAMTLDASGNLGIGTSSPSTRLHINASGANPAWLYSTNGVSGSYFGTSASGEAIVYQAGAYPLGFYTNSTLRATIDSSGNLGLGVTPSAWSAGRTTLQINGTTQPNIQFTGNPTNGGAIWTNSFFDGTSPKYVATGAASIFATSNGGFQWQIAPSGNAGDPITFTQAMTLDASGRLGIGTTSPFVQLHVSNSGATATFSRFGNSAGDTYLGTNADGSSELSAAAVGGFLKFMTGGGTERARIDSGGAFRINNNGGFSEIYFGATSGSGAGAISVDVAANAMRFYTNASERARIDSSGNLLVGTTLSGIGTARAIVYNDSTNFAGIFANVNATSASTSVLRIYHVGASGGTSAVMLELLNASGSVVGTITSSGTATAYNTSSDYRLKEDVQPMTGALAKVAALKPCTYKWKVDGSAGEGFIAHELAEVVPQAVTGSKDAVNEDGSIKPQGIDTSFLVATLTAAIQELKAEFDAYKATHP